MPPGYVKWHLPPADRWVGLAYYDSRCSLVTVGHPEAVAHEVGHMLGLAKTEEYQPGYVGNPTEGLYVATGAQPIPATSLCFMGNATSAWPSLGRDGKTPERWIDSDHWSELFNTLLLGREDPEVLVVGAILTRDGQTRLKQWYALPAGLPDASVQGEADLQIRVFDVAGQLLEEYAQPLVFMISVDPLGTFPTDSVPVVVRVAFPKTAAWVELVREGTVVARVSPVSKVLRDSIEAIPRAGFEMNPDQRRKALLNKIDALEKQLAEGSYAEARDKLLNDIRKQAVNWLIDGYPTTSPLEPTKAQLLQVIDMMIERVSNMIGA